MIPRFGFLVCFVFLIKKKAFWLHLDQKNPPENYENILKITEIKHKSIKQFLRDTRNTEFKIIRKAEKRKKKRKRKIN